MTQGERLAEQLQKSTGMILLPNAGTQFDTNLNIPFYQRWKETLALASNNEITMTYQREPQPLIWLHHVASPQFSLGLPSVDYKNIMKKFISISVVVTIAFTLFSAYVAAYFLNRPLKELAEKARLIGQDIDSIAIEPSGPEEIKAVALAMNKMRTALDNMIKKQKFLLAGISHDLRTPLTRIHIATQILLPDANGFRDGINADIDEMQGVLHRFIELARFNIEETEPWQVGDIAQLVREVAAKYSLSETVLILSLDPMPSVRYKPMALQRYLYNLINNSMKYGGGNITISTHVIDNKIALSVSDQGSGFLLSAEELRSYSDLAIENKAVNGLGLRIVQLIAKMHEAELIVCNKSEGGAEVLLKLKAFAKTG